MGSTQLTQYVLDLPFVGTDLKKFPRTRYQGSKYKLLEWIEFVAKDIEFDSVLDLFGGSGSVSYLFKRMGKRVIYNDFLKFNSIIAKALIENDNERLNEDEVDFILHSSPSQHNNFIRETFHDVYFTDEENDYLDRIIHNINLIDSEYKRSIAYFALFQSCISKRPYNLFHRKNLYVRTAQVERSFGNKKTWDTPIDTLFKRFVSEANNAIFQGDFKVEVLNTDAFKVSVDVDLVYLDTPYLNDKGVGVDYLGFYHFLEGIVNYAIWPNLIDYKSKHLRLKKEVSNPWNDKKTISNAFNQTFDNFSNSNFLISYRDDGIPSLEELVSNLQKRDYKVKVFQNSYQYALSSKKVHEVLIHANINK
jgi:adenine-specific DNA methylase